MPKGSSMQIGGSPQFSAPSGMPDKSLAYPIADPLGGGAQPTQVNRTLKGVPREEATLEAEKGETAVTDLAGIGIPQHFNIGGKRHYDGGTPLNLDANSFIFSRDRKMKIKDPDILGQFGKTSKKGKRGYTPADIAKQYNNNKHLKTLMDPDTDRMERETAEMMISNNNLKLGALAMVQESEKGFPDGIPALATEYLERIGIAPEELIGTPQQPSAPQGQQAPPMEGMQMQLGGSTKRKVRIKAMPSYQGGGENAPSTSTKKTGRQNIPKEAIKWDITADGYDETQVQPGDYIRKEDGNWYKATGYTKKNYGYEDERLGELQPAYGHLENTVTSNPELQDAIYTNYKKHIQDSNLSAEKKARLLEMPKDQIINTFLQGQKQVYAINNSGAMYQKNEDGSIKKDADDNPIMMSEKDLKKWEKRDSPEYYKQMEELGFSKDELFSGEMTAVFQAAYRGLEDASRDDRFTETLANFNITPVGLKDSHGLHTYDGKPISPVDEIFGNTTAGQAVLPKELDQDLNTEEVEWTPDTPAKTPEGLQANPPADEKAPWWLQDIVRTKGAMADRFRIDEARPWQAQADTDLPDPTFFDPTRELAANAELANIATQGAGMYAGPQAMGARSSQIQGQAATNAANIIGQTANKNVGVANQFEMARSQITNQAAREKANLATSLYDKNVIADQQFTNAKNQAREQQRGAYIDAVTNRAQTQALNELYPQYNVDPMSGGMLDFDEEAARRRQIKATNNQGKDIAALFHDIKRKSPSTDDRIVYKMASDQLGIAPDNSGPNQAWLGNYMNQMQGNQ